MSTPTGRTLVSTSRADGNCAQRLFRVARHKWPSMHHMPYAVRRKECQPSRGPNAAFPMRAVGIFFLHAWRGAIAILQWPRSAALPTQQAALQDRRVEAIGFGPSALARYSHTGCVDHMASMARSTLVAWTTWHQWRVPAASAPNRNFCSLFHRRNPPVLIALSRELCYSFNRSSGRGGFQFLQRFPTNA
jgi:hypothetical protein